MVVTCMKRALKVAKGKSIKITKEQLEELLQTGESMGVFDMSARAAFLQSLEASR
jgi:hypothetical protein